METNHQCVIENQGLCPQQAKYTVAAFVSGTVCTLGWNYPQFIILQCVTIAAWLHHLQNKSLVILIGLLLTDRRCQQSNNEAAPRAW